MNAGLAAYLAKKKGSQTLGNTPNTMADQFTMAGKAASAGVPVMPLHPQMITAIRQAPKGKIPPGLAKYLAAKKAKGGKK